jgi:hypothetical protein
VGAQQRNAEEVIPASRHRNYLQSALYVIIVGVLAAVLLERLLTYAEAAEKAAMEATVNRMQSALYVRLAHLALRGEYGQIDAMATQSPFATAHARSANYLGEFNGLPADTEGGNWLFDRTRRELVYVPKLKRYLTSEPEGGAIYSIRYRVEVLKASKYTYTGVALRPMEDFRWDPVP